MSNPILQMISMNTHQSGIKDIVDLARGNPQGVFNNLMKTNPQFAQFVRENKNKSPEQIAKEHGIDPESLNKFMK